MRTGLLWKIPLRVTTPHFAYISYISPPCSNTCCQKNLLDPKKISGIGVFAWSVATHELTIYYRVPKKECKIFLASSIPIQSSEIKQDPLKIVHSCKVHTTRTSKNKFFLFSKLAEIWLKDVRTKRKWRNIEILKYSHLISYKYLKIL